MSKNLLAFCFGTVIGYRGIAICTHAAYLMIIIYLAVALYLK